jgi:hypothetical protein
LVAASVTARLRRLVEVRVPIDELPPEPADEAEPAAGVGRDALKDEDEDARGEVRAVGQGRRGLSVRM